MPHDRCNFTEPLDDLTLRVKALENILAEKSLINPADLT